MEVVFILFVLGIVIFLAFLGFRLLKWTFAKYERTKAALVLMGIFMFGYGINHFFFKNMEFVQSKVYPNLILVKYPVKDKNELNKAIKQKVVEVMDAQLGESVEAEIASNYNLRFYEYTKSKGINFFADAGTSYFIANEEDLGGFVSEELGMYTQYRLAFFYIDTCQDQSLSYCGKLEYFKGGDFDRTEVLSKLLKVENKPKKENL